MSLGEELAAPRRPTRYRGALLAPDLAMCLAFVTLFYCLFLFNAPQKLFRDSDAGWHIREGERILNSHVLPRSDPFSFSRASESWYAWEWAIDVLSGLLHQQFGLGGVVFLYSLAIAAASWAWVQLNWLAGGNFFLVSTFAAPMLSTANLHWLARPHVFSWLLLLGFLAYFESAPTRFRWRDTGLIALGSALWTNVHASFFLLPVISALYAISHVARRVIWNVDRQVEKERSQWFALAAIVSLAATFLNPYGFALHRHVVEYLLDSDLLDRVGEFQSFNYHAEGTGQILLMLGLCALGGVLALSQKKVAHFLLTVLFLAAALRSARGLPLAALLLLPLANGAITEALRRARDLQPPIRRGLHGFLQYSDRLRLLDVRCSGLVWVPLIVILVAAWLRLPDVAAHTGFAPDQFPVAAAALLPLLPKDSRVLSPDKYGGYLIYRFNGSPKVFFDGRSDFYGSGFMKDYIRLVEVRPGWRSLLERGEFTHALLPVDYSLVPALAQIGWKEMYRDEVAVLLAQ